MKCCFCGRTATLLCDFVLGFEIKGWTKCTGQAALNANRFEEFVPGKGLPFGNKDSECFTCDAPMCEDCSYYDGPLFIDGDKKHTAIETIDKCPVHRELRDTKAPVITAETAEKIRRQLWGRQLRLVVEDRRK